MSESDLPAFKLTLKHLIGNRGNLYLQSEADFLVVDWIPPANWWPRGGGLCVKIPWIELRRDPQAALERAADKITDLIATRILQGV